MFEAFNILFIFKFLKGCFSLIAFSKKKKVILGCIQLSLRIFDRKLNDIQHTREKVLLSTVKNAGLMLIP